jgi:hypothetical protein
MVALQNLEVEIIILVLSQKKKGMHLVSTTPPKQLIGF